MLLMRLRASAEKRMLSTQEWNPFPQFIESNALTTFLSHGGITASYGCINATNQPVAGPRTSSARWRAEGEEW
jgi:hypothetical protein